MEPYRIEGDSQEPRQISQSLKEQGYTVTAHPVPAAHISILQKPKSEEVIWVSKGKLQITWGDQQNLELNPGDRAVIPSGLNYKIHVDLAQAAYYLKGIVP